MAIDFSPWDQAQGPRTQHPEFHRLNCRFSCRPPQRPKPSPQTLAFPKKELAKEFSILKIPGDLKVNNRQKI